MGETSQQLLRVVLENEMILQETDKGKTKIPRRIAKPRKKKNATS